MKPTSAVRWHVDISATTSSDNEFGDAFPEASLLGIVLEVIQLLLADTIAVWWWYVDLLKRETSTKIKRLQCAIIRDSDLNKRNILMY